MTYREYKGEIYFKETAKPVPEDHRFNKGDVLEGSRFTYEFIGYLDGLRMWKPIDKFQ